LYQNCSLIMKFHLLIPGPTNKISTENRQSKSVYKFQRTEKNGTPKNRQKAAVYNELYSLRSYFCKRASITAYRLLPTPHLFYTLILPLPTVTTNSLALWSLSLDAGTRSLCTCVYVYIYICVYIWICINKRIYIYIYIYIYKYI